MKSIIANFYSSLTRARRVVVQMGNFKNRIELLVVRFSIILFVASASYLKIRVILKYESPAGHTMVISMGTIREIEGEFG